MSNAKKCDICGRFYEIRDYVCGEKPYNTIKLMNENADGIPWTHDYINLCHDCKASFEDWRKNRTEKKE